MWHTDESEREGLLVYVTQSSPSKKESWVTLGNLTKTALLVTKDGETARVWGAH